MKSKALRHEHTKNRILPRLLILVRALWQYHHWHGPHHSLLCDCDWPIVDIFLLHIFCQGPRLSCGRLAYQDTHSKVLDACYSHSDLTYRWPGADWLLAIAEHFKFGFVYVCECRLLLYDQCCKQHVYSQAFCWRQSGLLDPAFASYLWCRRACWPIYHHSVQITQLLCSRTPLPQLHTHLLLPQSPRIQRLCQKK